MSRVQADHEFLLASKPEHPLSPAGLEGWKVERTELRPSGFTNHGGGYVDHVVFVHYVSPPAARFDNSCRACQQQDHLRCYSSSICPCAKADHERSFRGAMCRDEESSRKGYPS